MRAREPDARGVVERDGVRVGYEVFEPLLGDTGRPTLVFLTSWAVIHMRQWKLQVPALARRFRVLTVEGRGNGAADRPIGPAAYVDEEYVADAVAAMDATGVERAVLVGLSLGARHALQLAAAHPGRVAGVVAAAPTMPVVPSSTANGAPQVGDEARYRDPAGPSWRVDHRRWAESFFARMFPEPHSTKQREDGVGWALQTDAATLDATSAARARLGSAEAEAVCRAVACPVLVVHGDRDEIVPC